MRRKIVTLCGGVGGARCAVALTENLPHDDLVFLINTGDDFTHLGLEIWPDWDTVVYHLAGIQDGARGWGRADEGVRAMEEFRAFGAPCWFHLGDRDLALHIYRTWALANGMDRSRFCRELCQRLGIEAQVLPFSEQSMATKLRLDSGETMDFQEWFVKQQGQPIVKEICLDYTGVMLNSQVAESLTTADLILLAPSNPYLSLGPMMNHPQFRSVWDSANCAKLAVSPLIDGKAVKGPLDRLIESLSPYQGQEAILDYWNPWVDAVLLPPEESRGENSSLPIFSCPTLLSSAEERKLFVDTLGQIWNRL